MNPGAGRHDIRNGIRRTHLVELHIPGGDAMDFPLGHRDPVEDRERAGFYIRDQGGLFQQFPDVAVIPPVRMVVSVRVGSVAMAVRMPVIVRMRFVFVGMGVPGLAVLALRFPLSGFRSHSMAMHLKFHAGDVLAGALVEMRVDFVSETERGNRLEEDVLFHTQITERTDSHVAADS